MSDAKIFRRERYADLMPIIEAAIDLQPGKHITVDCPIKSPHTVGQKIREFFRLATEQRPELGIDYGDYSVSVFAESRKVKVRKNEGIKYGAVLVENEEEDDV